jgi:hypothetical protein
MVDFADMQLCRDIVTDPVAPDMCFCLFDYDESGVTDQFDVPRFVAGMTGPLEE